MTDNENAIKRIRPHDDSSERRLIGAMFMNHGVIPKVSPLVSREDFYNPHRGSIYDAMVHLHDEGVDFDDLVLGARLREMGLPEDICSLSYIGDMIAEAGVSIHAEQYARTIRDKAYLRRVIDIAENISVKAYEQTGDVGDILGDADEQIFKLIQSRNGISDIVPIKSVMLDVINDVEKAARTQGQVNGIRCGFIDLDKLLNGLHGGELIIVAARPAMGKTALVLNMAYHVAAKENVPVGIFSLEMDKKQLAHRIAAIDSRISSRKLQQGDMDDSEWMRFMETTDRVAGLDIYIDDTSQLTLPDLRAKCRKMKRTHNIGLICIDYLQLISPVGNVESTRIFIQEVSRTLKSIAKELDVPVVALSQLSRAVDSRQDKKPVLADLRESGSIEQDADVVMFIYRDDYYNKENSSKPGIAEIIVAKQRSGSTGSVDLAWNGELTRFANLIRTSKDENVSD